MRAFIIAAFGNREIQVRRLLKNIRSYSDIPIHIITTGDSYLGDIPSLGSRYMTNIYFERVKRQWPKGSYREGQRNSNYLKIQRTIQLQTTYDSVCLLDDDMLIVNKNFVDGFAIAEKFGAAVPVNPRLFQKYNAMGADVHQKDLDEIKDWPQFATACNFSPFFLAPILAGKYLSQLEYELIHNTCRVTLAMWKAGWKTRFTPVILPEQWCVCGSNAKHIKNYAKILKGMEMCVEPIMLHLGHKKVETVFKDMIDEKLESTIRHKILGSPSR